MMTNLQQHAVESVKRRGFLEEGNIPPAARNHIQMERILSQAALVGRVARHLRKNYSVPGWLPFAAATVHNALLMAQMMRHIEENGELADALLEGNPQAIRSEIADVFITLSNIAALQCIDIESAVMDKLAADERRGHLHGEEVTAC